MAIWCYDCQIIMWHASRSGIRPFNLNALPHISICEVQQESWQYWISRQCIMSGVAKHYRLFLSLTLYEDVPPALASFQLVLVIHHWCAATSLNTTKHPWAEVYKEKRLKQHLVHNNFKYMKHLSFPNQLIIHLNC